MKQILPVTDLTWGFVLFFSILIYFLPPCYSISPLSAFLFFSLCDRNTTFSIDFISELSWCVRGCLYFKWSQFGPLKTSCLWSSFRKYHCYSALDSPIQQKCAMRLLFRTPRVGFSSVDYIKTQKSVYYQQCPEFALSFSSWGILIHWHILKLSSLCTLHSYSYSYSIHKADLRSIWDLRHKLEWKWSLYYLRHF